jgi:putative oxygen-independent coproporphyrinogen III oxidase
MDDPAGCWEKPWVSSSPPTRRAPSPLGVYLHAPFCVSHCTYCDFYTRSFSGESQVRSFSQALGQGLRLSAEDLGISGRSVDTIYFGGGTPSLLEAPDLEAVMRSLDSTFLVASDAEISIEANPESLTPEKLRTFRALGFNRLSLGVQSFEPAILLTLGRAHSAEHAVEAFEAARRAGFENVSFDLMLALPGQSLEILRRDLKTTADLAPDHLSAYLLEMDKETALRSRIERGELQACTEDEAADLYELTRSELTRAGFRHYELSNFALEGKQSRHNLKYWTDLPFVGFGPSAWSYLDGRRFREAADLEGYLEAVRHGAPPRREPMQGESRERLEEALFSGLRLVEGVDLAKLAESYGVADPLGDRRQVVKELEEAGFVRFEGDRLRLTRRSYSIANEIFQVFV